MSLEIHNDEMKDKLENFSEIEISHQKTVIQEPDGIIHNSPKEKQYLAFLSPTGFINGACAPRGCVNLKVQVQRFNFFMRLILNI